MSDLVWSLSTTPANAKGVFEEITKEMSDAILMCLLDDGKINPTCATSLDTIQWNSQQHGWLFNNNGELKWRRLDNGEICFVYIGNQIPSPQQAEKNRDLSSLQQEDGQLVAWGIFDSGNYQEEGIGDIFAYPCNQPDSNLPKPKQRLAFKIRKYREPNTGKVEFWRHLTMEPANTN